MENHHFFHSYSNYLVGGLNLKNIGQLGLLWLIIPNVWKNKKCSKPPNSYKWTGEPPRCSDLSWLGARRCRSRSKVRLRPWGSAGEQNWLPKKFSDEMPVKKRTKTLVSHLKSQVFSYGFHIKTVRDTCSSSQNVWEEILVFHAVKAFYSYNWTATYSYK